MRRRKTLLGVVALVVATAVFVGWPRPVSLTDDETGGAGEVAGGWSLRIKARVKR